MSLILDALNKSGRERGAGEAAPGLDSPLPYPRIDVPPWRAWVWPALAALFALVALGLWLDGGGDDGQQAAAPAAGTVAVRDAGPDSPAPSAPPATATPATDASDPTPANSSAEKPAISPEQAQIAALYSGLADEDEFPPINVDILTKAARAQLDERRASDSIAEDGVPFVGDLSQSVKDEIPSVYFIAHHWSTVLDEREVVLNGETRKEGDIIKPGLRLVEIGEHSILLDFRGTEFRLPSLSSWVNF